MRRIRQYFKKQTIHSAGRRMLCVLMAVLVSAGSLAVTPGVVSAQTASESECAVNTAEKGKTAVEKPSKTTGKIVLTKEKGMLYAGETMTLHPKKLSGVKSKTVRYKSNRPKVASVTSKGVIRAKKKGTAVITVTSVDNKKVKTAFQLTVKAKPAKCTITLKKKSASVLVGNSTKITVKSVTGLSSKKMCYKSADNKIASVTSKGVVKGKKKGTTVITVTSAVNPKISTSFRVTVKKPQIAVTSIETASEVTLEPGSGIHLRTTVTPMEATNKKLTFTSADPQVAKVLDAEEGKILGIQVGTTTVTIQSADKKVTKKVRIVVKKKIVKVKEIHIKDCESYFWNYNRPDGKEVRAYKVLKPGQSWKAECEIKPLNATSKKLYWTSSDPSMVTVSQDGTITAVGLGENAPYGYSMSKCEVYAYSCDGAAKSEYVDITVSLQMTPKQTYQYLREHPKMNSLTMYVPKSLAVRWYEYLQKECPEKTKSWWDGMSPQEYWDNDYKAGGNKEYQTTPIGGLKVKYKGEIYWRFDNIGLFDIQTEKSLKEYETEEYDPNLVEYFGW